MEILKDVNKSNFLFYKSLGELERKKEFQKDLSDFINETNEKIIDKMKNGKTEFSNCITSLFILYDYQCRLLSMDKNFENEIKEYYKKRGISIKFKDTEDINEGGKYPHEDRWFQVSWKEN